MLVIFKIKRLGSDKILLKICMIYQKSIFKQTTSAKTFFAKLSSKDSLSELVELELAIVILEHNEVFVIE